MIYTTAGKQDSARPIIQRVLKSDPLNTWSYLMSGAVEIFDGQFSQAVGFFRKAHELEPLPFLKWWIAKGLAYNNELKEACELLNSVSIEASGTVWDRIALFFYMPSREKNQRH